MRIIVWFLLLNKRLFHKWSFVFILILAPLLVYIMKQIVTDESGVLKILLYQENYRDEVSQEVVNKLLTDDSIIQFERVGSAEQALSMIYNGNADSVWMFSDRCMDKIETSVTGGGDGKLISVIEREDSVALKFAREKLYSVMYPYYNYAVYKQYTLNELEVPEGISEKQLKDIYMDVQSDDKLFQIVYPDGELASENSNYLIAPVRGLLAVWFVLCGLVSCMYYITDEDRGVFARIDIGARIFYEIAYHLIMLLDAGVVMLSALWVAGLYTTSVREIVSMLVFGIVVAVYCMLIRRICRRAEVLGAVMPLLIAGMLVFGGVFINLNGFAGLRFLQPVYLYISSIHSVRALMEMIIYGVVLFVLCYMPYCIGLQQKK